MSLQFRPEEKQPTVTVAHDTPGTLAATSIVTPKLGEKLPTFRRIGKGLVRPILQRPRLTKRRAIVMLVVSGAALFRWWDANQEPNWPVYVPTHGNVDAQTGPNAANFYHAAIESFTPSKLPTQPRGVRSTWYDLSESTAPLSIKRVAMQQNAEALKWLHEAGTKTYYGNYGGKWLKTQPIAGPKLADPVPNFLATRELARTAAGTCDVLAAEGQHLAAVDRALDIAKWGTDMTNDPTMIEAMIGILIQGIGYKKAAEHIDSLTPKEARVALARLEAIPAPVTFSNIVRHEELMVTNTYKDLFQLGNLSSLQAGQASIPSVLAGRAVYDALIMWYTKRGLVENYTRIMDQYSQIGAMPYREALAPGNALQARVESGKGLNFLTRVSVPNFIRARWAYEARVAQREVIRARLMLTLWKAEHTGKLPTSLSELKNTPLDPFSAGANQPLQYDSSTGKVWSVGNNGINDSGLGDDTLEAP